MGADIHAFVEAKENDKWEFKENIWDFRSYDIFAFLADVRNGKNITVIKQPTNHLPEDVSDFVKQDYLLHKDYNHSLSYLYLTEILAFKYDKHKILSEYGNKKITYKELLGNLFFDDVHKISLYGKPENVRVIFWFDS